MCVHSYVNNMRAIEQTIAKILVKADYIIVHELDVEGDDDMLILYTETEDDEFEVGDRRPGSTGHQVHRVCDAY